MNETIALCLEIIFWLALFIVFYTYLGYGIVLYVLVKLKELFVKPDPGRSISIIPLLQSIYPVSRRKISNKYHPMMK